MKIAIGEVVIEILIVQGAIEMLKTEALIKMWIPEGAPQMLITEEEIKM